MVRILLLNGLAFTLAGLTACLFLADPLMVGWTIGRPSAVIVAVLVFLWPGYEAVYRTLEHGMRRGPFLLRYMGGLVALAVILMLVYTVWSDPVGLVVGGAVGGLSWGWLLSRWAMDGAAGRTSAFAVSLGMGGGQMVGLGLGGLVGSLFGWLIWGGILGLGVGIGMSVAVGEMNRRGRRPEEIRTVSIEA